MDLEQFDLIMSEIRQAIGGAQYQRPTPAPYPIQLLNQDGSQRDDQQIAAEVMINQMVATAYNNGDSDTDRVVSTLLMPVPNKPLYWYFAQYGWHDGQFDMFASVMDFNTLEQLTQRIVEQYKDGLIFRGLNGDQRAAEMLGGTLTEAAGVVAGMAEDGSLSEDCGNPECVVHGPNGLLANARKLKQEARQSNDGMIDGIL